MLSYRRFDLTQMVWGLLAWGGVSAVALGRVVGGWQARRAAMVSSLAFAAVVACYVLVRVAAGDAGGGFL
jgi:ABC-type transport system involved in cytochrome c biogenesis permease subunit